MGSTIKPIKALQSMATTLSRLLDAQITAIYDPTIALAEDLIYKQDGRRVSVVDKGKSLIKFGKNNALTTSWETVWLVGGDETYQTDNVIDTIVSDNAGDTQEVIVEGHTIDSNGDFTFVVQSATLNGTTNVALGTPLARANRMYNAGSADFAGTVRVFENGGTDHLTTEGDNNQSLKAATTISKDDYWIITGLTVSVNRQNTRSVDFALQIREKGGVFRTRFPVSAHSNGGGLQVNFPQPIIVRPNSDIRLRAISSGADTQVEGAIHGYLATIKY